MKRALPEALFSPKSLCYPEMKKKGTILTHVICQLSYVYTPSHYISSWRVIEIGGKCVCVGGGGGGGGGGG